MTEDASHPQTGVDKYQRSRESVEDVIEQIQERILAEGDGPVYTCEECLLFAWKLYQKAEEEKVQLVRTHGEEMEEVDHYVEHIKQLSTERDEVLQNLELENRQLKEQVVQLTDDPNATREELEKILEHQGLEEIADYSRLEQVAFLLAERAQLLDELEALHEQNKMSTKDASTQVNDDNNEIESDIDKNNDSLDNKRSSSEKSSYKEQNITGHFDDDFVGVLNQSDDVQEKYLMSTTDANHAVSCEIDKAVSKSTSTEDFDWMQPKEMQDAGTWIDGGLESDIDLQKLLEKERREFEDKLQKQHEFWQTNEKRLKNEHEEEVNTVLEENDRLEEELSETRLKMEQFEKQVEELKQNNGSLVNPCQQGKKEISEESGKVASSPGVTVRRSSDVALRKVIGDKTKVEMELMSLKSQLKNLEHENKTFKSKVDEIQSEAEQERDLQQQLRYRTNSLKIEVENLEKQLETKTKSVEKLTREKNGSHTQVELLRKELKDMKIQKEQLETWQDIAEIMSNDKKNLSEKVDILTAELRDMRIERDQILEEKHQLSKEEMVLLSQLDEAHREVDRQKADYEKVTKDYEWLECAKLEQASRIDDLLTDLKNLSNEKDLLEESSKKEKELFEESFQKEKECKENLILTIEELQKNVEDFKLESQESAKNRIVIVNLQEQNQVLADELEQSKMKVQEKQTENEETVKKQQQIDEEYEKNNERLASEVEDLKTKLQLTLEELSKSREDFDDLQQEQQTITNNMEKQIQDVQMQLTEATKELEVQQNKVVQSEEEVNKFKDAMNITKSEMEILQQKEKEDLQRKLWMIENDLSKKLEKLKEEKEKVENDLKLQLKNLQQEYQSIEVQLQATILEKNETESQLMLAKTDCDQFRTLVSNLENTQKDLNKELLLTSNSKEDVSQKLELTLQKLETVQLELLNREATGSKKDEEGNMKEDEVKCSHFQGRIGDGRSADPSPRDFGVSVPNGKIDDSFENRDLLNESTDNIENIQKTNMVDYQNGVPKSEGNFLQTSSHNSVGACQDATDSDKDFNLIVAKEKLERIPEKKGMLLEGYEKSVSDKENLDSGLRLQVERLKDETQQLRLQLESKQKEILQLQHDATEAKLSASSAMTQLHVESKLRNILENKNSSLNSEVFKVYDDVKQLIKRSLILETSNQDLQSQLNKKNMSSSDSESLLSQRSAQQIVEIRSARERIVQAEIEAERLKQQIHSLVLKQSSAESELNELLKLKPALAEAKNEAVQLRRRYEEEKMKTKLLQQTQNYMRQEIHRLQSAGLNQSRLDKEDSLKNSFSLSDLTAENGNLLQEVNDLKLALLSSNERHEMQQKRNEERKHRIRTKFLRARELHNQERSQLKEQLSHLREDLLVARSMFTKEHELRQELDGTYKRLSADRRELLSKNSEQLQKIRELTRNLSMHEVQLKFLEDENKRLQEKVIMANQRHSASLRANQKMIFQHQLSKDTNSLLLGTISGNLESVINRPLPFPENGMFSLLSGQQHPDKRQTISLNKDEADQILDDSYEA